MKSICKNIAFSESGKCLLGDKCICESNKLWIADEPESEEPNQDVLWDEAYDKLDDLAREVDSYDFGLPMFEGSRLKVIGPIKSLYTISRK